MKPKMKNFFRQRQWWAGFWANFFGALLGIVVTFGTSSYLDYREKKAMGRTAALMTISNIEFSIQTFDVVSEVFRSRATVFKTILKHYPDELYQVSEDTLYMYINSFNKIHSDFIVDSSAEGIFTHSSDIWRTLDNPTLQQRIGSCFSYRNFLYRFIATLYQKQQDVALKFLDEKYFCDHENLAVIAKELTAIPAVRNFMMYFPSRIDFLDNHLQALKLINKRNMQDMHISDEELSKYLALYEEEYEDDSEAAGESNAEEPPME